MAVPPQLLFHKINVKIEASLSFPKTECMDTAEANARVSIKMQILYCTCFKKLINLIYSMLNIPQIGKALQKKFPIHTQH